MGGNLPYFVKDNRKIVDGLIGMSSNPIFATKVKVGDKEYLLKDLIVECRIEPTEDGRVYVHPDHGKNELAENLEFAKWRADIFGEEVILLPNPQNVKSADSYNITREVLEEYKRSVTPTKNSIDHLLREGAKQADHIILEISSDIDPGTLQSGIKGRVAQNDRIVEIRLRVGNAEAVYSREQILSKDFKIKPEDFHNASASRSEADRSDERSADAKVANLFGLNKKTPQEIAIERHAKRDSAAIQQAWNERRIENIKKAVADGFLPKDCVKGLASLPQEEFNVRIELLQKTAARHAARTPTDIDRIKEAWEKNKQHKANIRIMADKVLGLRTEYPYDVDFSALDKFIAEGNLTKMQQEAKRVGQAIKAIRDEEKALADLIPDARGWHKMFDLSELKEAHAKIQATLDYWKAKGYDLATDSNLSILKTELEQKIKFVENPGAFKAGLKAHKTWQVQQDSYIKLLDKVETRMEIIQLEADYNALLSFKTTSKQFNEYMAKAKIALDAGNPAEAKKFISLANVRKKSLEAKRKGKAETSGSISFPEMDKAEVQKLLDRFEKDTVKGVDKPLRKWMESEWANLSDEEQLLLTKYTQAYTYLNDRLRGLPPSSWRPQSEYDHDMPIITQALNKLKALHNMVVRRGTGDYPISELGKYLSDLEEGDIFTEPAFLSTAAHRDKGFFKSYEMIIVVPKGARGAYAEPFSHYNDHCCAYDFDMDKIWNGSEVQKIGDEFEWIGQRGCQFKVLKKTGGKIIMQLIGQLK